MLPEVVGSTIGKKRSNKHIDWKYVKKTNMNMNTRSTEENKLCLHTSSEQSEIKI